MQTGVSIRVDGQVQWNVSRAAGGQYIAQCEPLGLAMEGTSLDDLFANISESIQLVMNDLLQAGELDEFLRSRGWRAIPKRINVRGGAPVSFDVPINLVMQAQRDSARAIRQ